VLFRNQKMRDAYLLRTYALVRLGKLHHRPLVCSFMTATVLYATRLISHRVIVTSHPPHIGSTTTTTTTHLLLPSGCTITSKQKKGESEYLFLIKKNQRRGSCLFTIRLLKAALPCGGSGYVVSGCLAAALPFRNILP